MLQESELNKKNFYTTSNSSTLKDLLHYKAILPTTYYSTMPSPNTTELIINRSQPQPHKQQRSPSIEQTQQSATTPSKENP